ncbi:propionate catabolism operon regulatory protein PrpR [Solimonas sp. K1W22B-7]|uniref:propionate catabolism operon regulatory protein PrpR n=1 Tax=Solimonas sp. K1W22B-7 TaxID=2303331 RepID=UPI000E33679D|nr:propionate catabolism operon regulatory protein PrpR [Solimonas sp. K1W22B-7]AXQ28427.1 propionate catabolism operon regulatory protein PrpR [Solimonas sp. K1W22B-7]
MQLNDAPLPTIWTVSVTRLSSLMREVTPEFDGRAHIETIDLGFEEAVTHIRERLRTEDCDVVLSAGSNGEYLRNRIDKPIVLVRPDGFDLMQALTRARRHSDRIGVISYGAPLPAFAAFKQQFGLEIEQRSYTNTEEARDLVTELASIGCGAIVGTGYVTELADRAGIPGILMYSPDAIRHAFEQAIDLARMLSAARSGQRRDPTAPDSRYSLRRLIGNSESMVALRDQVRLYGASDRTVLVTGETGTGKELVAQALHGASPRRAAPFIAVNCGAIAESLLESELFGYADGAFTGSRRGGRVGLIEAANGGTLFLDEIGEMPLALQTRLLRVLEEREVLRVGSVRPIPVDVRVVAATHSELDTLAAEGRFRRDLYYRLNVLRLALPPLREHAEDVPLLLMGFLRGAGAGAMVIDEPARALLLGHSWPGNVRELRNLAERIAVLVSAESPLSALTRPSLLRFAPELAAVATQVVTPTETVVRGRQRPDAAAVERALQAAGGDRAKAAELLGVSRTTLWRWLSAT